jgi:hypothetical protein
MTDFVIRSRVTRTEDYHTVYIMPNAKCEMRIYEDCQNAPCFARG